ncbi:Spy/CpxP family protein refolding chaperone [Myxococcus sp. 1LA]
MLPFVMVLAIPVLACAQEAHAQRGGPRRPPTSLELLLENCGTLALTPEQVGQVSELSQALEEQNAPLHQKLHAMRPPGPPPDRSAAGATHPDDSAMRTAMEQARAVFQELEANDSAAYAKAETLLTSEQQTRASQLIAQAHEDAQKQRAARHERMRGRP